MKIEELELTDKELKAITAILRNGRTILPVYRRLADKFLDLVFYKIDKYLNDAEETMKENL